jgi:TolB-like protein/DNA-binding winged helix-turn-helix (wHTH) protein/Flp pilus assembly protein TadD
MNQQLAEPSEARAPLPRIVRFGLFEADLRTCELLKQGRKLKLQSQPFQILATLLERRGEIVTRDELCRRLWPEDTFVDFEHSLNTAVRRLREALSDSSENPVFIETLQRRGYRFIAPVVQVEDSDAAKASVPSPDPSPPPASLTVSTGNSAIPVASPTHVPGSVPSHPTLHMRTVAVLLLLALLAGASLALWVSHLLSQSKSGAGRARPDQVRSLAVLPLENLSFKPDQDYLADGMTDELIASLAKVKSLRVIPRTTSMAYKGSHKSLSEIARDLNVDAVVEGTVMRSGDRVRITAELVQIAADRALWAETYDSSVEDVLSLQQRVAGAIVSNIQVELTPSERQNLRAYQPSSPEAYEDYLKGRYYWNKRSVEALNKAIEYFERATKEDPNYALAYAGLADCYGIIGAAIVGTVPARDVAPKAEAAARRALELDPTLAEAQTSLATVSLNYKWDWQGAESGFKKAIQLDPNYATAHQRYSLYLIAMGRTQDSLREIQQALKIDPFSVSMNFSEGWRLFMARDYKGAIRQLKVAIDMDPTFALAHMVLGQAYAQDKQLSLANTELQQAIKLSGDSSPALAALARVYALSGQQSNARLVLERLKSQQTRNYVSPFYLSEVYASLGDQDSAMNELEKAYEDRSNSIIFLRVDPEFDSLRSNPRFQTLLQRLQL